MDHVVQVSTEAYAGTAHAHDFVLFHDGLSAWWEARAQAHMKEIGFEHRQIRNLTANVGTRYEGKIVGDSPEMCRALDSHGFADLKAAVMAYSSLTSVYEIADSRRFKLGTPAEVYRSIERPLPSPRPASESVKVSWPCPLSRNGPLKPRAPSSLMRHYAMAAASQSTTPGSRCSRTMGRWPINHGHFSGSRPRLPRPHPALMSNRHAQS
mmetsp:Transcript_9144/g.20621  ORF Transcript_9144/g.20621 Transcript_9144/m.20621 type:complete len:210 (+) Transcript_9144:182-811(+)